MRFTGVRRSLQSAIGVVLLASTISVTLTGCTDQQKQTTLQVITKIHNYEPAIQSAIDTGASVFALIDPAASGILMVGVPAFDELATDLHNAVGAYLASPSPTQLGKVQDSVTNFEAAISKANLNILRIVNPASQNLAKTYIGGFSTLVGIVFGLIQSTMTPSQVAALAATHTIDLSLQRPLMSEKQLEQAARDSGLKPWYVPASVAVDRGFAFESANGL